MPSPSDPILRWRHRERFALAGGGTAVLLSAMWAFWPLPRLQPPDATLTVPDRAPTERDEPDSFTREAFAARIWNPPPVPGQDPVPIATVPPPSAVTRLQLIGIVHDDDGSGEVVTRAAIYDPETDKLHIVASGESIGLIAIAGVDDTGVDLASAGRTTRLVLRRDADPGGMQ